MLSSPSHRQQHQYQHRITNSIMYQLFISDVIKQKQIQKTQSALVLLVALPIDQQLIRAPAQSERRAHAVWNMLSARRLVNAASMPFYGSCAYHS